MTHNYRELCEELLGALEDEGHAHWPEGPDGDPLIEQARAALAQAEPEAVGDEAMPPRVSHVLRLAEIIREVDGNHDKGAAALAEAILSHPGIRSAGLASVVGEPGDENCWQWYTYCPEEGLEMYSEREQAQSAAQSIMGSYEVAAYSDGWHEDMESVSWGMLVPVEQAQVVERKAAEPGGEFDEWVKYELRPARYGHQPAPVPVSERLPEPEDCDGEGLCWVWNRTAYTWGLFRLDLTAHSHWLPATALPLPQGEVQP